MASFISAPHAGGSSIVDGVTVPTPENSPNPPLPPSPSLLSPVHCPSPPCPPMPPLVLTQSGRPARTYRQPAHYQDELPKAPPAVIPAKQDVPPTGIHRVNLIVCDWLWSLANSFGLWWEYDHQPSYDPDEIILLDQLANYHNTQRHSNDGSGIQGTTPEDPVHGQPGCSEPSMETPAPPWPWKSMSVFNFMTWFNTGGTHKTIEEVDRLVKEVILDKNFCQSDFIGFNTKRENEQLDKAALDPLLLMQGFASLSVSIDVPSGQKNVPPIQFTVSDLQHRDLLDCIHMVFASPLASKFHLSPFKLFHLKDGTDELEHIFGELYTSDAFIQEHDKIQRCPLPLDQANCKLEWVVAVLMFWSDSTHLATFGNAKL
uniref:Uncharacterized protein n=1 Tax=Moniliophthora roreri TaxID=221103 RepID=A0A0W0FSD6_MONRR